MIKALLGLLRGLKGPLKDGACIECFARQWRPAVTRAGVPVKCCAACGHIVVLAEPEFYALFGFVPSRGGIKWKNLP
jgi:hypothetical protein